MSNKFIIATGGSGGHIFPALILADKLKRKGHDCLIIADKKFLNFRDQVPKGMNYKIVMSATWQGSLLNRLISLVKIEIGIIHSLWILLRYKPKALISFGGYISFPVTLAAIMLKIPTLAHEQNAVIGKANRAILKWLSALSVVFKDAVGVDKIAPQKVHVTPNPVKAAILEIGKKKYPELKQNSKIRILILGGSQGARLLSAIVPSAITSLESKNVEVFQQCRKEDLESVKKKYDSHGVKATVATFFNDVPAKLALSHLIICRAGASTVCEVLASHRPAIFIPLASAADNHQYLNAQMTNVSKSASWIIEEKNLTPLRLSTLLTELIANSQKLIQSHNNSRFNNDSRKYVDSGEGLVNLVEKLANGYV